MKNYLVCKQCGEEDDKKTKTGATIDGVYYCEGCYTVAMDAMDADIIASVFNLGNRLTSTK